MSRTCQRRTPALIQGSLNQSGTFRPPAGSAFTPTCHQSENSWPLLTLERGFSLKPVVICSASNKDFAPLASCIRTKLRPWVENRHADRCDRHNVWMDDVGAEEMEQLSSAKRDIAKKFPNRLWWYIHVQQLRTKPYSSRNRT